MKGGAPLLLEEGRGIIRGGVCSFKKFHISTFLLREVRRKLGWYDSNLAVALKSKLLCPSSAGGISGLGIP